jgi:hypothetical protein
MTLKENPASEESSEEASISDDDVSKPADGIPKPEPDEEPNSPPVFPLFASVPGYKTYSFEFECFIAEKTNSQAFGISSPTPMQTGFCCSNTADSVRQSPTHTRQLANTIRDTFRSVDKPMGLRGVVVTGGATTIKQS